MSAIRLRTTGNFNKLEKWLNTVSHKEYLNILDKYGQKGVEALAGSTPVDTGKTAASWQYVISSSDERTEIYWTNTNRVNDQCIAILLQYGHGTRNGGYVVGRDYINPALQPVFDEMAQELWKEYSDT